MSHESSLTTVALLSAYTEDTTKHYLDLLIPFVECCIPSTKGTQLDFREISNQLGKEFGIMDMPINIVETIVRRYAKLYPEALNKTDTHTYTVQQKSDNTDFDRRRQAVRIEIDGVSKKLDEFIDSSPWKKPQRKAKDLLLSFFQAYGLTIVNNVDNLYSVARNSDSVAFIVAKFVLWAYNNDPGLFASLIDLTKGFLTYRAIYQIDEGDKQDHMSRLRNVKCFLDCSLLISLLGYDTQESQTSVLALMQMLHKNGGTLYTFSHTISEARSVLLSYTDSPNKIQFRLPGLKAKHLSDTVIRTQALALEQTIKNHGILVYTVPDDAINDARENAAPVMSILRDSQCNAHRSEYDLKSLAGIKMLRKGTNPPQIENCTAILITQDTRLISAIKKHPLSAQHEVAFAKLDADMIALLWLQTFTACPDMPKEILLSNAAAATSLSDEVRKRAIELTEIWVQDGSMTPGMASMIRSDRLDELLIAEHTANDPEALTMGTFKAIMRATLEPEIEAEIEVIRTQEEAKYHRRAKVTRVITAQRVAEQEQQRQLERYQEQQRRITDRNRRIVLKAEHHAKKSRAVVQAFAICLLSLIALSLIVYQVHDTLTVLRTEAIPVSSMAEAESSPDIYIPWWKWVFTVLCIIMTVSGTISFFHEGRFTLRRLMNALERKVYVYLQKRYEQQAQEWDTSNTPHSGAF